MVSKYGIWFVGTFVFEPTLQFGDATKAGTFSNETNVKSVKVERWKSKMPLAGM